MNRSLSVSSVHGTFPARMLKWVAMPSIRDSPTQGLNLRFCAYYFAGGFFNRGILAQSREAHFGAKGKKVYPIAQKEDELA